MGMNRRKFILGGSAVTAAALIGSKAASAARGDRVEHHVIAVRHPDLDGKKIAQLTDLHHAGGQSAKRFAKAMRLVNREDPDMVVLTGDYVTWGTDYVEPAAELISLIRAPRFAVLGNHDHYAGGELCTKMLQRHGTVVLNNSNQLLRFGSAQVRICGVDDYLTEHHDLVAAVRGSSPQDDLRILLVHVPNAVHDLARDSADLILCGHTHGGQILIPWLTDFVVRKVGSDFVKGFYNTPAGLLYVNRGWGMVGPPVRVGVPAEVTIFHLKYQPR